MSRLFPKKGLNMASVDVIIPAYNCYATINRTLASLAMQTLQPEDRFRVTIVDDCSTDGEDYDLIRDYWSVVMDVDIIHKPVNQGCGQARQTGIDVTDGDYIVFIDADDVLCSPFSLDILLHAIEDADMAMGAFLEETAFGTVPHNENFTWCHGKIYRRSFLDENNIRFNLTRGNEDVGFNTLIANAGSRISYVPDVVHVWINNTESTVRKNADAYRCGHGWRDFIENIAWSVEEQTARNEALEGTRDFAVELYTKFYFQLADSMKTLPEENEENLEKLKEYYRRAVHPFASEGRVTMRMLEKAYRKTRAECLDLPIPEMSFGEYLSMTGYYEDMPMEKK